MTDPIVREALRIHHRYLVEVVEAFGLCPWAERARRDGHVSDRVFLQSDETLGPTLDAIGDLAADPRVEIGLAIYARFACPRVAFEHFVARLREADAERYPRGQAPFAMAAFHPEASADTANADRLIPFLRRSPFPTIQLVRFSVLERVRGSASGGTSFVDLDSLDPTALLAPAPLPVRDRIAQTNLATVQRAGAELARVIEDIHRDRDTTLARLRPP